MNSSSSSKLASLGLIGLGLVLFAWQAKKLENNPEAEIPLNIMGMNRSPYGALMAIALQGQIDTNFHLGVTGTHHNHGPGGHHHHGPGDHDHDHDHHHGPSQLDQGTGGYMQKVIGILKRGHMRVTNPVPPSPGLRHHIRNELEDKLRFAYQLDPSHYANYNTLHFFLAEELNGPTAAPREIALLALGTYDYCMQQEADPRPVMTAVAACVNLLNLQITLLRRGALAYDPDMFTSTIQKMEKSFIKYQDLASAWNQAGTWETLSAARFEEHQRYTLFLFNQRTLTIQTIQKLHQEYQN